MPLIPAIFIRLNIAAPFYPGSANVQPMKPGCAEQASSSRACSIILDFFILVLCNTPLDYYLPFCWKATNWRAQGSGVLCSLRVAQQSWETRNKKLQHTVSPMGNNGVQRGIKKPTHNNYCIPYIIFYNIYRSIVHKQNVGWSFTHTQINAACRYYGVRYHRYFNDS